MIPLAHPMAPLDSAAPASAPPALAPRWTPEAVARLLALPFPELVFRAQSVHREHFDPSRVQLSTLLSIKTGGCPEDCAYCPQSVRHPTGVADEPLLDVDTVLAAARAARDAGATRFCMGAAWRGPKARDLEQVAGLVRAVKALGLETCATLGLLRDGQAEQLREAGLDYYNHNLDTSPERYGDIISTRQYEDRLATLRRVREAGLHVCCGGIVGMGEGVDDRAALIAQLASLDPYPESVPINALVQVKGTPLHAQAPWTRWTSCASSPPRASPCPARGCACRPAAPPCRTRRRPCAFWRVPTPSSTAIGCSPPATPRQDATAPCCRVWAWRLSDGEAASPPRAGRVWRPGCGRRGPDPVMRAHVVPV